MISTERGEAYAEFMAEHFGGVPAGYLQLVENALEEGYQAMTRLLALNEPPTAVFAADDNMAIGAMKAAAENGVAVPADLSIVGFDDIKIAGYLHPALTTVHQPYEEIACKAVELLLEMIRDRAIPQPAPHVIIPPQLVERNSCAPPKEDGYSERAQQVNLRCERDASEACPEPGRRESPPKTRPFARILRNKTHTVNSLRVTMVASEILRQIFSIQSPTIGGIHVRETGNRRRDSGPEAKRLQELADHHRG